MPYTINDSYHKLTITLTSNFQYNDENLWLEVYKSDNETTTPNHTYYPTVDGTIFTFNVLHSHFNIGDVLNRFRVVSDTVNLQDLDEGITILVDGVETDTVYTSSENPTWTHTFDNEKSVHTVQAVFKGNSLLKPYFDTEKTIKVKQKNVAPPSQDPSLDEGDWKLECLTSQSNWSYGQNGTLTFKLTRGGKSAPNGMVVELSEPIGTVNSKETKNGLVSFDLITDNGRTDAGTYNVVARFYDYTVEAKKTLTSCTKKITISKLTPTITFAKSTQTTDGHARFYVRGLNGEKLKGYKCSVWVNGKKKTTQLSDNGNIGFNLKKKGTYKLKVYVNASTNYKSASLEQTETKR